MAGPAGPLSSIVSWAQLDHEVRLQKGPSHSPLSRPLMPISGPHKLNSQGHQGRSQLSLSPRFNSTTWEPGRGQGGRAGQAMVCERFPCPSPPALCTQGPTRLSDNGADAVPPRGVNTHRLGVLEARGQWWPPLPCKCLLLIITTKTTPGLYDKYHIHCPLLCKETWAQKLSNWPKVTQLAGSPLGIQGAPSDSKSLIPTGS